MRLKAPFPWFGGKSRVAHLVWRGFSDVPNYVEPFAGSLAVMLGRPHAARIETVNDRDMYLANFWRAVQQDPEGVAFYANWPVNEADLHARHRWLVRQGEFRDRMKHDPEYFDVRIAGWWVWGIGMWIGGGWCAESNWNVAVHRPRGVHTAQLSEQLPSISGDSGASGRGIHASGNRNPLVDWMLQLADRLRRVRVCCGDWKRVMGRSVTECIGVTGIFLDPPYSAAADRDPSLYAAEDLNVAHEVREWAIANGENPNLRIALCGYAGEHVMPKSWQCVPWKAVGGYAASAGNTKNSKRERIWFSPACLQVTAGPIDVWEQTQMFGDATG